ncbi:hypothetical protein [Paenisporosarcina sp. NPDC076898]|uniref:hypothetical protein n=1 Tax=unclassified Paenisporosarcina TaxID=2642018 RepID=UPI003D051108
MNTTNDILRIIGDLGTVGAYVASKEEDNVTAEELKEAYINAANKVSQAERELKALKLSKEDGKHLSLIRDAFQLTRKALIAASQGNGRQAEILILQAKTKVPEYELRKAKSKRPNG